MSTFSYDPTRGLERIESADECIDRLERELAASEAAHTTELARLDEELAAEKAQAEELRAEVALCNGTIESRDRNIEELSAEAEIQLKRANEEQAKRLALEAEVERLHKDAERLKELSQAINGYLSGGGLFNPEQANHVAVRDLLIEIRDAIGKED